MYGEPSGAAQFHRGARNGTQDALGCSRTSVQVPTIGQTSETAGEEEGSDRPGLILAQPLRGNIKKRGAPEASPAPSANVAITLEPTSRGAARAE